MECDSCYKYEDLVRQLLFLMIDKAAYLKSVDSSAQVFDERYYDGQVMAYHLMVDAVFDLLVQNGFSLDHFGLGAFDPNSILDYRPK